MRSSLRNSHVTTSPKEHLCGSTNGPQRHTNGAPIAQKKRSTPPAAVWQYEQVIHIGSYDLAPDFTFLDFRGSEFYWEYCGMMGDEQYRHHQLWRRGMYESIGITEWDNMIYTYDAKDSIDMREIAAIIETKILPRLQTPSL